MDLKENKLRYLGYKFSLVGVKRKGHLKYNRKKAKGFKRESHSKRVALSLHLNIFFETSAGEDRFQTEAD